MRFCPFCSAENADELAVCQSCGRRLPPLPPRRARQAPGTGVQLPPRASTATQPPPVPPRRMGSTNPPPPPAAGPASPAAPSGPASPVAPSGPASPAPRSGPPPVMVTSPGFAPLAPSPGAGLRAPAPAAATPAPQPAALEPAPPPALPLADDARALANVLSPGPAAQRREAPLPQPADPAEPGRARRRTDLAPPASAAPRAMPSVLPGGSPSALPGGSPSALPGGSSSAPSTSPPLVATPPSGPRPAPSTSPLPVPPSGPRPAPTSPPPIAPSGPSSAPPAPPGLGEQPYPRAPAGFGLDAEDVGPPPTRIHRPEALVDRPFAPPRVSPIPEIPEPGLIPSARYSLRFARARWQRRGAIKLLGADIKQDTDALDQVLGALGGVARTAKVEGRVFSGENAAITAAEERVAQLTREHDDVDARKLEENARFVDVEHERNTKLEEASHMVDEVQKELAQLEAQRRELRDRRKDLERRQKAYLKSAEDADKQTGNTEMGAEARQELRRTAEHHRREAAAIEPERQDSDRKLAAIERPIGEATAKLDAAKAELDAAKRSLADAREGHTHRLAELDAEQKRKAREIAQAEGEIARRLVTLGTLVNLNRIEDPQFSELYGRIDRLRGAITARTTEIEKLTAEREAYDRGTLVRGVATIGGAILVFIALIVILRAILVR